MHLLTIISFISILQATFGSFTSRLKLFPLPNILRSFSIDDGNGNENVSFKMNSRFFKLCRVYSNLPKMASVGEFPWS